MARAECLLDCAECSLLDDNFLDNHPRDGKTKKPPEAEAADEPLNFSPVAGRGPGGRALRRPSLADLSQGRMLDLLKSAEFNALQPEGDSPTTPRFARAGGS